MKTQYRIIKKDIYEYLQYSVVVNFILFIFIRWKSVFFVLKTGGC